MASSFKLKEVPFSLHGPFKCIKIPTRRPRQCKRVPAAERQGDSITLLVRVRSTAAWAGETERRVLGRSVARSSCTSHRRVPPSWPGFVELHKKRAQLRSVHVRACWRKSSSSPASRGRRSRGPISDSLSGALLNGSGSYNGARKVYGD